ncbi:hypothetical protein EYC80_000816 [Monilinia laxa]|uniref:Uncharacterized protein n=1 Tax=Monilinia laxa TaxID=61186 RepID=A0A5N6K7A5_MONLA|nr:hypothetical protein EYC80_000816 [Monilinia laxa]
MNRTPQYELPKIEWLNKRGWEAFKDFMVTHGYNPLSVKDYMKAQELLCNYRASDPFANQEEKEEDEDDEELEELDEGFEGFSDLMEDEREAYDEVEEGSDTMNEFDGGEMIEEGSDIMDDYDSEEKIEEGKEEEPGEGSEGSEKELDESEDEDEDEDQENNQEDETDEGFSSMDEDDEEHEETLEEKERRETIYRTRCEDLGIHQWLIDHGWECIEEYMEYLGLGYTNDFDVEVVGEMIQLEMSREMGDIRTGIEEAAGGMDLDYNSEYNHEQQATSEKFNDENEVARQTSTFSGNGGGEAQAAYLTENAFWAEKLKEISEEIDRIGWVNFDQFMVDHQFEYRDYEEALAYGRGFERFLEWREADANQQIIEEGLEELSVSNHRNHNTNQDFQNQIQGGQTADNEVTNGLIQSGDDEEMTG